MSDTTRSPNEEGQTPRPPLTLLLLDQEEHWQQGVAPTVEDYLHRHPGLRTDTSGVLLLVHNEVRLRGERGDTPRPEEYTGRFPELASQIRGLFELEGMVQAAAAPSVPTIPGYEIVEKLGEGGMGVVYKAWQKAPLRRLVALKMIRAGAVDAEFRERFRIEAEAIARLQHPNIIQIHDFGEQDGLPYFSLELIDGGSLDRHLAGRPVPPRDAATLVATLARAMQHVHERGLIHRDLKPANVLLARRTDSLPCPDPEDRQAPPPTVREVIGQGCLAFEPKITDFGLAKRLDVEVGTTLPWALLGTPSYMAPEQAAGRIGDLGPPTDVHALGAILYEMLTGRPPFQGASLRETLDQVCHQDPVRPSQLQPKCSRDLETICLKCLHKVPTQRYPSARELAEDLDRFLKYEPIRARPTPWWQRLGKWVRRHPAWSSLAAAVCVVVVGVVLLIVQGTIRERRRLAAVRSEVQGWLLAGQAALQRQEWPQAQEDFSRALTLVEAEPALADLQTSYLLRAQARVGLEDYSAAEEDFQRTETALRTNRDPETSYLLPLSRGLLRLRQDRPREAAEQFRQAAEQKPGDYQALVYLARVSLSQGDLAAAEEQFHRAVALGAPTTAQADFHTEAARSLFRAGKCAEAVTACDEALAVDPGYPDAHGVRGLALLYGEDSDPRAAVCALDLYFQKAEERRQQTEPVPLSPRFAAEETGPGDYFRARAWARFRLCDYRGAVEDYSDALRVGRRASSGKEPDADLYLHRGAAYFFTEAWQLAEADFSEALRLDPTSADAYAGRGYARVKQDDLRAALEDARSAEAVWQAANPAAHSPAEFRILWFNIACIYAQAAAGVKSETAGEHARRAVAHLRAVLDSFPDPADAWVYWRDELVQDPALDPLRKFPEYQDLLNELDQARTR